VSDHLKASLGLPSVTILPNFEANYAALKAVPEDQVRNLPRDWQKHMGAHAIMYFEGLAGTAEGLGFAKDGMMQEALAEAVGEKIRFSSRLLRSLRTEATMRL
jgi:hypothetical protein